MWAMDSDWHFVLIFVSQTLASIERMKYSLSTSRNHKADELAWYHFYLNGSYLSSNTPIHIYWNVCLLLCKDNAVDKTNLRVYDG